MLQLDLFNATIFGLCIILSAFFSSSEVALISITRAKVRALVNDGRSGADALFKLKQNQDHILITLRIGNTIAIVAAAAVATSIAIEAFGDPGLVIAIGGTVLILLIFGEIGPKLFATRYTEPLALRVAPPILFLSRVVGPVFWLSDKVSRSLVPGDVSAEPTVTEDEIREWIDVGMEEGTIEQEEQEMLYNVLELGDTTAREVMTPRVDVAMIEDTSTLESSLTIFHETGFSRLPVFHEKIDNLTGVLNIKDVYTVIVGHKKDVKISDLMYDPYFVPETKKIDDLLKELQLRKVPMAMVMDEYGGFVGVVTVEDILEELVGDILDEFDDEEPELTRIGEGIYMLDARMWVDDLNEQLDIALPTSDTYETIGGLLIEQLGHIPHPGETVRVEESNATLVVMQMRGKRIVKVKMILSDDREKR
jgi:CBS domain containing-hemolysin-like protein